MYLKTFFFKTRASSIWSMVSCLSTNGTANFTQTILISSESYCRCSSRLFAFTIRATGNNQLYRYFSYVKKASSFLLFTARATISRECWSVNKRVQRSVESRCSNQATLCKFSANCFRRRW